ncbi:PucR family transcriptional regulator [Antrihabitans sp. YC3-6]|uniref:PucR family transcriptional regulator n=1 Tax=Antrihabitans stalagmiti TaxID=2799499 RepID=A0A934NUW4_9NOCA|nr:PucR family transcriptional regulator [Antrihabitans stalagmiti]MBJ8341994.1 PucR family transcriptional regulator [Antrihabitans stalagmiti]
MAMTVAEIIDLPVVQAGKPKVLSSYGLDTPVRWVHVSDVSDLSDLLQGGELVLTTGAALRRSPRHYLAGLSRERAVGVVVELGAPDAPLPADAGSIAAELGLALIALHRVIRFVDVTEQVHRAIVAEQFAEVAFARRTHEMFTDLGMQRGSPTDIVDATAQLLDTPIVLEDLAHQAVAVAAAGHVTAELLRDWERRSRLHVGPGTASADTQDWISAPVGRHGEEWGRLIALRALPIPRVTMVLERAAQALVLHRMAERDRFDIEHQAQAGLLEDVLQERIRNKDDITARAFALGLRPVESYVPATVRCRDWPHDADPVAALRRSTQLLDAVVHAVKANGHTGLFSIRGSGEVGMVLSLRGVRGRTQHEVLDSLAIALHTGARRQSDSKEMVFGIATPQHDLVEAIRRIGEAGHVAEVALSMPSNGRICFRVNDIRIRGLVSLLRGDPRVQRFAEAELRVLILHDIVSGDRYVEILRGYVELAGNKSALANRLHMSRPALYAKLARIQDILGVDLADGESMTSLHVALLVSEAQSGS